MKQKNKGFGRYWNTKQYEGDTLATSLVEEEKLHKELRHLNLLGGKISGSDDLGN